MIAPQPVSGKAFLQAIEDEKTARMAEFSITKSLKGPTITPYFGQSSVTLGWDKVDVASKARSGSSSGFLIPPAPRGSADRASLSNAYGSIP